VSVAPARLVLLGHPVAHSLSPTFQNAALRSAGLPIVYEALDVAPGAFAETFRTLAAQGAAGNVTVPHKPAAARVCERLTPLAQRVGAVNTFWVTDGALVGDNTDVGGFDYAVRLLLGEEPRELKVALIGAGGAAAAVLAAVERWPRSRATIWNRTVTRTQSLAERFSTVARAEQHLAAAARDAQLVVNATTVGLDGDDLPVDPASLAHGAALIDLVYRRGGTAWVRLALALGMRACDGLPMLVEQGALAFERWFGKPPDRDAMWAAVGGRPAADPRALRDAPERAFGRGASGSPG
jgi:shikimate dehydrogenase